MLIACPIVVYLVTIFIFKHENKLKVESLCDVYIFNIKSEFFAFRGN